MSDLVKWLRQQFNADEQAAPNVHALDCELTMTAGFSGPCTCGWADRLLAEVDADRAILDLYEQTEFGDLSRRTALEDVIRLRALPRADRPGYRPEWRP
ncbi:DUF6221 family protein [Micromonospora chalcea]|uniref:DUF6221 family protein n=1 Tax=Micromonospora chalcea TaxID=1874 RepID=UPI003800F71B